MLLQKVEPIEEAFLSVIVYRPEGEHDKATKFSNDIGRFLKDLILK